MSHLCIYLCYTTSRHACRVSFDVRTLYSTNASSPLAASIWQCRIVFGNDKCRVFIFSWRFYFFRCAFDRFVAGLSAWMTKVESLLYSDGGWLVAGDNGRWKKQLGWAEMNVNTVDVACAAPSDDCHEPTRCRISTSSSRHDGTTNPTNSVILALLRTTKNRSRLAPSEFLALQCCRVIAVVAQ